LIGPMLLRQARDRRKPVEFTDRDQETLTKD
jgi:hypothetical protein